MPSNIYDTGTIPQIRGNIDLGIAASSVPFEPLKVDPNLYKSVMDTQLQQQKLLFDKEELQYKRDVLDNNAEQFWQEQNSTAAATLLGYNSDYMSKAKKGTIDTPGASMPYYDKQFQPYRDKLAEVQSKYAKGEQNREIQKLLLEKISNPEYRKSVDAGTYWNNTLTKINDIAAGKIKGFTTKNIDWNKFNAVSKNLADENIPVNPDDLMIKNFIIEDKDKIIESVAKVHTTLRPQSETIQKDGKDLSIKAEVGLSPYDMYNNIYNELLSNENLVGQLKSDYGYSLKDEQILEGGYDSREDMIGGLVQSNLSYEAMMAVNRGLGLSVAKPEEFSKDQYKRVISTSSLGTTIEEQKNLKELETENKIKVAEAQGEIKIEVAKEQGEIKEKLQEEKHKYSMDEIRARNANVSRPGTSKGKSKNTYNSKGSGGMTANLRSTIDSALIDLDAQLSSKFPRYSFELSDEMGTSIKTLGGISNITNAKEVNGEMHLTAISSDGKKTKFMIIPINSKDKGEFKDERNNAGHVKGDGSEYVKFEETKGKEPKPVKTEKSKSGGFGANVKKILK